MTDTKTTGERLADQASEWALALGEVSDGPIITSLYGTDISKQIKDVKDILNRCSEALSTQDQQDTAMAWTLAKIRQIIGVDEKPMLSELPDLVRAAVNREWLPIEDAPYNTTVRVKIGNMTFLASLAENAGSDEDDCGDLIEYDQWQADTEGEHPPCWSDGCCWSSNVDEEPSLLPTEFQHIALAKENVA